MRNLIGGASAKRRAWPKAGERGGDWGAAACPAPVKLPLQPQAGRSGGSPGHFESRLGSGPRHEVRPVSIEAKQLRADGAGLVRSSRETESEPHRTGKEGAALLLSPHREHSGSEGVRIGKRSVMPGEDPVNVVLFSRFPSLQVPKSF